MFKKYLFCICLISSSTLFGFDKTKPQKTPTVESILFHKSELAFPPTANGIPKGFNFNQAGISYTSSDLYMQSIMTYLFPGLSTKSSVYAYQQKIYFRSNKNSINYIIFNESSTEVAKDCYTFIWKKKAYNKATDLEKKIADYYQVNNKSKIECLYLANSKSLKPSEAKSSNQPNSKSLKQSNTDPWAIKINDTQTHAIICLEAYGTYKEIIGSHRENLGQDSFLVLNAKEAKAKIQHLFIDENDRIIGKRIDGVVTFRNN